MPSRNDAALAFLTARRSRPAKLFSHPVPDRAQLDEILTAALRVPDHGKLEPWRLLVLQGAAFARLADLAEARAHDLGGDAEKVAKGRGQYDLGKLAVVVIASPKPSPKIPAVEQLLSAGALCLGIVNAAEAAGWGANWLTGWPAHDPDFAARAFGCQGEETVAGIVHIGTPAADGPDRPRPDLARLVTWVDA
ncbi:nitroreductase family protein [Tabrizicola aquatica]|uniref:nitroreductase family protein n=1 Tax=Tabrizicola aquatica TaxID=909926 RepID=UPI000CD29D15|nr:nitroreductase [Tabrizicola aquatica]